jgi:flagellar protein FliO/FliZ
MNIRSNILILSMLPLTTSAADVMKASPSSSILKMALGLAVVLAIMAFITWVLKRMMPLAGRNQSVARVVGGVSVGSREKIVVVEIADRWIVVGVAPGQVSAIANIDAGANILVDNLSKPASQPSLNLEQRSAPIAVNFSEWLKKSVHAFTEKSKVTTDEK